MANTTKLALEASLKKMLLHKKIDKITINDLTTDCGISRMTFYYHFKDIYELVEWVCVEDGRKALQGKKTYDTWQECYSAFYLVLNHATFKQIKKRHSINYSDGFYIGLLYAVPLVLS